MVFVTNTYMRAHNKQIDKKLLYKEDTNKSIYSFQGMINALSSYAQDTDYG